jgi:hypothetical protein
MRSFRIFALAASIAAVAGVTAFVLYMGGRAAERSARAGRAAAEEAVRRRLVAGVWSAWSAEERTRKTTKEHEALLAEAETRATPQEAHDALFAAAGAGHPAAQLRLAFVYDIWGWGGWVRDEASFKRGWTAWMRKIDFASGEWAIPVSRAAPNAADYRRQALLWYHIAATNGVHAAVEALRLHAAETIGR